MPPRSLLSDEQMSSPPPAGTPRQLRRRAGRGTVSRLPGAGAGAGRGGAGRGGRYPELCHMCHAVPPPRRGSVHCADRSFAVRRTVSPHDPAVSRLLSPSPPVCSRLLSSVSGARLRISSALPLFIMLLVLAGRTPHIETSPTSTSMYVNIRTIQILHVHLYFYRIKNPLKTIL